MSSLAHLPSNAVEIHHGAPKTNSLIVAEVFGKLHKNVLRDIEAIKEDCPTDFNGLNFEPVIYTDAKGERRPMVEMTRDGFTLLVMGYTGANAMQFKVAYIQRFNEMEAQLRDPARGLSVRLLVSIAPDGRYTAQAVPHDAMVIEPDKLPAMIGDSMGGAVPKHLIPQIIQSAAMRLSSGWPAGLPMNHESREPIAEPLGLRDQVLREIAKSGADGRTMRDLRRYVWGVRQATPEEREALMASLVNAGEVTVVRSGRRQRVFVAARSYTGALPKP